MKIMHTINIANGPQKARRWGKRGFLAIEARCWPDRRAAKRPCVCVRSGVSWAWLLADFALDKLPAASNEVPFDDLGDMAVENGGEIGRKRRNMGRQLAARSTDIFIYFTADRVRRKALC